MKVSIITVCLNSERTIDDVIQSVISQDYPDIEYIIVDGNSTDKTLQIISKYSDTISKVISEPDEGMYFAINKGIGMAGGDIVTILNADDLYISNDVISKMISLFSSSGADSTYGDLIYVDRKDTSKIFRYWKSENFNYRRFKKGWMPPHPTFFVKKKIYEKYGLYNTNFQFAADYELMLRFLYKHKISTAYLPEVIVKMRLGGKSNVSIWNRMRANREDRQAWKINDLKPGAFTLLLKPLLKWKQFLAKP